MRNRIILFTLGACVTLWGFGVGYSTASARTVPACQEDEVVAGQGDFHASGYWDRYVCVNVDEFKQWTVAP